MTLVPSSESGGDGVIPAARRRAEFDLCDQRFGRERFAQVFARQIVGAIEHVGTVQESRHHDDRHAEVRVARANESDQVPSVAVGHADVDHQHLGAVRKLRHRLSDGRHEHSAQSMPFEHPTCRDSHHLVVIDDEDASRGFAMRDRVAARIDREHGSTTLGGVRGRKRPLDAVCTIGRA